MYALDQSRPAEAAKGRDPGVLFTKLESPFCRLEMFVWATAQGAEARKSTHASTRSFLFILSSMDTINSSSSSKVFNS
jgi:hypothetical protein